MKQRRASKALYQGKMMILLAALLLLLALLLAAADNGRAAIGYQGLYGLFY